MGATYRTWILGDLEAREEEARRTPAGQHLQILEGQGIAPVLSVAGHCTELFKGFLQGSHTVDKLLRQAKELLALS